jgi:hypothetical protein
MALVALAFTALAAAAHAAPTDGVRLAPATPGAVRFTVTVPVPKLTRIDQEQGLDALDVEGYAASGEPGTPVLPGRVLTIAVPPLGDVRLTFAVSEAAVHDGVTLAPVAGLDAQGRPVRANRKLAAYGAAGSGTPVGARLLDVSWMRNQRVARVSIEPVAYEPAARRLTVAARVDVELAVTTSGGLGPPAEPDDPFENVYRLTLVNYQQGIAWRRPRAAALAAAARRGAMPAAARLAIAVPPDTSIYAGRTWIKLAIQKTGFYAVNFSRLRGLALFDPVSPAPFDSLRLFTWPGRTLLPEDSYCDSCDYREVAIGVVRDVSTDEAHPNGDGPADGLFKDNNDTFYFFAQGPDGWESDMEASRPDTNFITHPYEKNNFYYLTVATDSLPVTTNRYAVPQQRIGVGPGTRRSVKPVGGETPVTRVAGRVHYEQDNEFWPDATAIRTTLVWEKWFWLSITSGQSFSDTRDLVDADTTQAARLRLRQWGLSDNHISLTDPCELDEIDHFLDLSYNSVTFPRRAWNGQTAAGGGAQTFDTSGVFLKRRSNRMSMLVPTIPFNPSCAGRVDRSGLAFYEVFYQRLLQPQGDAIDFRTHPDVGTFRYDIGPCAHDSSNYLFDITDPTRPVLLDDAVHTRGTGVTISFADTQSVSHRYALVPDEVIQIAVLPASAIADAPFTSQNNLRSPTKGADYLVIYFDEFKAAAESLATWRESRLPLIATPAPHISLTVPISAIYDQFSGGRTDPGAIRNFLRAASGWSRRPLYVTFLGDASFDFKNNTGRAQPGLPGCLLPRSRTTSTTTSRSAGSTRPTTGS